MEVVVVSDVGVLFTFRVMPDPESDREVVEAVRGIFEAMAVEEFPSGEVKAYAALRDRADPGKWVMFEHFTGRGSELHARGPLMQEAGRRLAKLFVTPPERLVLEPVLFVGCGEPIGGSVGGGVGRVESRSVESRSVESRSVGSVGSVDVRGEGGRVGMVSGGMLGLDAADRVVAAARRRAAAIGVAMNVAVVDEGGNLAAFVRMDGAWLGSISIAQNKAFTARAFDMDTKVLGGLAQPGQPLYGIEASNGGRLIVFAGGVPLRRGGVVVGAVGVSGGSVEEDQDVAEAGAGAL